YHGNAAGGRDCSEACARTARAWLAILHIEQRDMSEVAGDDCADIYVVVLVGAVESYIQVIWRDVKNSSSHSTAHGRGAADTQAVHVAHRHRARADRKASSSR